MRPLVWIFFSANAQRQHKGEAAAAASCMLDYPNLQKQEGWEMYTVQTMYSTFELSSFIRFYHYRHNWS
jgi:hypothetical protein